MVFFAIFCAMRCFLALSSEADTAQVSAGCGGGT